MPFCSFFRICWEIAVLLALCSCCSCCMQSKLFRSLLLSRAGCGIRLYEFLIIAFSSTFRNAVLYKIGLLWNSHVKSYKHSVRVKHRRIIYVEKILNHTIQEFIHVLFGPRQANLVLIAYANSEDSHPRSLARTFAARSYKQ